MPSGRADRVPLEALELAAYLDLYEAATPTVTTALGLGVGETENGVCLACSSEPSNGFMNRIRGLNAERPLNNELLRTWEAFLRSRSVGVFGVDVGPGSGRDSVIERLTAHGFVHASQAAKLVREGDLTTIRHDGLFDIVEVEEERAHDFASVWVAGLPTAPAFTSWMVALPGRSGWHCHVAYRGGEPVACAATRIDEDGRCWLGYSATLPEHRGQGAQRALLAELLTQAQREGCSIAATETAASGASLRNVLRAGFSIAYRRELFVSPSP